MVVAWVIESQNNLDDFHELLDRSQLEECGRYSVDIEVYRSSFVQGHRGCYLVHHSNYPETTFVHSAVEERRSRTIMADKGIDLIVSKLLMVKDDKTTYSVTGKVYRINDIVIRIGRAVVNGVAKNVLVELAYEATSFTPHGTGVLMNATKKLFQLDQQLVMGSHLRHYVMFRETFTPSDIADQYVNLFYQMRKRAPV
ncbi:hypothetical protein QR680_010548 [Steinernema hermaphroditum]|uniref:Mediator of RNA polymerase II transcription subunit 20 n=1 Tax=Steinernema hermaphroditum TaxID=289476 RepID=A0AA39IRU8_9BILA|nr:hypothetical protein QR680_010548 [Steinernema hermaphroditum]